MKKSNVAVYIIVIVASAFLLWLWFYLGLDEVDYPLDLVISIIWWVLVVISCIVIYRVEKRRQEAVRTTFLTKGVLFNPEAGIVNYAAQEETVVKALQDTLSGLKYSFERNDLPQGLTFDCIVRSKVFKGSDAPSGGDPQWEGEVAIAYKPDAEPIPFTSREELESILKDLGLLA